METIIAEYLEQEEAQMIPRQAARLVLYSNRALCELAQAVPHGELDPDAGPIVNAVEALTARVSWFTVREVVPLDYEDTASFWPSALVGTRLFIRQNGAWRDLTKYEGAKSETGSGKLPFRGWDLAARIVYCGLGDVMITIMYPGLN